ncbi:MAG: nucleotidyltransferase family protein [Chloroflexi bacterium]|nr:nucleotidyltransferase family protein [Chloroflexota bacterium]
MSSNSHVPQGVAAIVLAAGLSTRMGTPKMTLPWGDTTVLGHILEVLRSTGLTQVCVVTGGARELVEEQARLFQAQTAFNPQYENGEMLSSLQTGLSSLPDDSLAALVILGDQPQIEDDVVRCVAGATTDVTTSLVIPSYHMRRGHPWLVGRRYWPEILALKSPSTMRDFINTHKDDITYVNVATPSILMDLDTPEEYRQQRPRRQ